MGKSLSRNDLWLKPMTLIGLVLLAPGATADLVDSILASVDTEVVLYSEVISDIAPALREAQLNARSDEEFDQALQELLRAGVDQAIENKILVREALLAGLEVGDEVVDKQLGEFKAQFSSAEAFLDELRRTGYTVRDLRNRLRNQLLARRMAVAKRDQFEKEAVISEAAVSDYYESHREEFVHPERVRCRQIFLAAGPDPDERARARARVEQLREELEAGADFGELAEAYSEAPGAEQGGLIGWVQRGDLVHPLDQVAFSLPEGGVSDIQETAGGVHILEVVEKGEAGLAPLEEVRALIEPELRKQAAEERYETWMAELRGRSRVRVFYSRFSAPLERPQ